jgi:hypothetical protein
MKNTKLFRTHHMVLETTQKNLVIPHNFSLVTHNRLEILIKGVLLWE